MARILLEIIASTVNDCLAAESGGADRIELCAAIGTGGLTASLGTLIEAKKRVRIPVMAMVRPRAGGFCYSDEEFAAMRHDAQFLIEHGADGIVFGALHSDGSIDAVRCGKLLEIADGRQAVFHRAFDAVPEPVRALDTLIDRFEKTDQHGVFKLVCDFNANNQENACNDYYPCAKLADYLTGLRNKNVRVIGFVHDEVTRHSVLPLLACWVGVV